MHRLHLILTTAFVLCAHGLQAQARADTTVGFRQGQWGAEFIPSSNFAAGVLRFSRPTRAWVVDGSVNYNHFTASSNTIPDQTANQLDVSAQVGPRWYHTEYERVVRFVGLGVIGRYSSATQSANNDLRSDAWSAGVYGELGLQYMFTRHLGLGVRDELAGSRQSEHFTQTGLSSHLATYTFALQPPQIIGAFYF